MSCISTFIFQNRQKFYIYNVLRVEHISGSEASVKEEKGKMFRFFVQGSSPHLTL